MKTFTNADIYQIRASHALDMPDYKTMLQLYQPILGSEAVNVYFSLMSELDQLTLTKAPSLFSRLVKITGFTYTLLAQAIEKLEAVGLMKTYLKESDEHRYLFDMYQPLQPQAFLQHKILNALLKQRLAGEYDKTVLAFMTYHVRADDYKNISASFSDVFDIQIEKQQVQLQTYQEKKVYRFEDEYDLDLFYQGLEKLQISKKMLNKNDEQLIKQMGMLYHINALDMQECVKKSIFNYQLDSDAFIRNCRDYYDLSQPEDFKEIFHKQSVGHASGQASNPREQHIYYLEHVSPYDLLKDKQGGREPLKRDLQTIESILTTLQLEPGVMNVLIELTLKKCNQALPKAFMESIGGTWKRKNIVSVKEAMEEGRAYLKNSGNNIEKIEQKFDFHFTQPQSNDIELDDEMLEILQKYE